MKIFILNIFCLFCFSNITVGQLEVSNTSEIQRIKGGVTYITFKDTNSPISKEYMDIYRKYWTISKIRFINDTDLDKYIAPENSFFTMNVFNPTTNYVQYTPTAYSMTHNSMAQNAMHENMKATNYQVQGSFLYMSLWVYDEKYFSRKKKGEVKNTDKIRVARVELFPDYKILVSPDSIYNYDYDWGGHIRNWGPGILKNYIQSLMSSLNNNKEISFEKNAIANKSELTNLKTEKLYVPDYTLTIFGGANGDESHKYLLKDLFKEYQYSYDTISSRALNNKILKSTKPFYYLVYVKDCDNKIITVINSLTGEIIYSVFTKYSYNIKHGDLDDLSSTIKHSSK